MATNPPKGDGRQVKTDTFAMDGWEYASIPTLSGFFCESAQSGSSSENSPVGEQHDDVSSGN